SSHRQHSHPLALLCRHSLLLPHRSSRGDTALSSLHVQRCHLEWTEHSHLVRVHVSGWLMNRKCRDDNDKSRLFQTGVSSSTTGRRKDGTMADCCVQLTCTLDNLKCPKPDG